MNLYERDGIAQDLEDGKTIAMATTHSGVSHAIRAVLQSCTDLDIETDHISLANGQEHIRIGEGRLQFARTPSELAEIRADLLVVSPTIRDLPEFLTSWYMEAPGSPDMMALSS